MSEHQEGKKEEKKEEGKKQKDSSIFQITLNLTVACLISGCIIAGVYFLTADTAVQASIRMRDETMMTMIEGADSVEEIDGHEDWYQVYNGSELLGYILTENTKGYGGTIELLVAIDPDLKVITYSIQTSSETPGLGENASKTPFLSQFTGKTLDHLVVTKDANNTEDIQAMSGATITSKAVTLGVKNAVEELQSYLEGGE